MAFARFWPVSVELMSWSARPVMVNVAPPYQPPVRGMGLAVVSVAT